jgi:hypothetical protein
MKPKKRRKNNTASEHNREASQSLSLERHLENEMEDYSI